MMKDMVTTAEIAKASGLSQRVIQKRIKRLEIQAQRVGVSFLLTLDQAERIRLSSRPVGRPRKKSNGK